MNKPICEAVYKPFKDATSSSPGFGGGRWIQCVLEEICAVQQDAQKKEKIRLGTQYLESRLPLEAVNVLHAGGRLKILDPGFITLMNLSKR